MMERKLKELWEEEVKEGNKKMEVRGVGRDESIRERHTDGNMKEGEERE